MKKTNLSKCEIKERPILFNYEMVRAVITGNKTQTRRVKKSETCPYGEVGDRLWVRETHTFDEAAPNGIMYLADLPKKDAEDVIEAYKGFWKPSIFMKRKDSRILLEVVSIHEEKVCDISRTDAIREGCPLEHRSTPVSYTHLTLPTTSRV